MNDDNGFEAFDEEKPLLSVIDDSRKPPPFSLNVFLLAIGATIVFAMLGFLSAPLPDMFEHLSRTMTTSATSASPYNVLFYTVQIPFALFVGATLGTIASVMMILLYLVAGIFFIPVFANGGGLQYLSEPGFPYFIGMMAGAALAGFLIPRTYPTHQVSKEQPVSSIPVSKQIIRSWFYLAALAFLCLLIVHVIGAVGIALQTLIRGESFDVLIHWVTHLSGAPLLYDLILSLALLWLSRPVRMLFWLFIYP